MNAAIHCIKCTTIMQPGYIPDALPMGQFFRSAWVEADETAYSAIRQVKDQAVGSYWITAYRCPTCGYLELYAIDKHADANV